MPPLAPLPSRSRLPAPAAPGARRRSALALAAVIAAAVLAGATFAWKAATDPEISWLQRSRGVDWVVYPKPGDVRAHPGLELPAVFRRDFALAAAPARALLRVRALRRFGVAVNGRAVLADTSGRGWRAGKETDVSGLLHAGTNRIEATVGNPSGPPALWARLEIPGGAIASDGSWDVSWAGASWRKAVPAGGPLRGRRFDSGDQVRSSLRALASAWRSIVPLAILSAALLWVLARRQRTVAPDASWPLRVALAVAAALWTALFVNDARWLPLQTGFDASHHLDYIRYVLEHHALPAANRGWEMYQPPLYYVLAALVLGAGGLTLASAGAAVALRLLGLVFGLANLALVAAAARLVFPGQPRRQVLVLAVAAFLPATLVLYQLPGNEALAVTLSSAVLLLTLRALPPGKPSFALYPLLGAAMGLALLAKLSALLAVVVSLGALLAVAIARPERRGRTLAGAGAAAAVALLVCGWHYGRVWARFGTPLLGNWDVAAGFAWWQDPGYRTPGDYLRFGRSVSAPFWSAFAGVWDGLYSTLWGDGLGSGVNEIWWAPPWCSDVMSAGYLLALLPSAAILLGAGALLVRWIREPRAREGALLALGALALAALLGMTLKIPSYAQAKAIYGLTALLPLCVFAALGLDLALSRAPRARAGLLALAATWALSAYAASWIGAETPRARAAAGADAIQRGDAGRGVALLEEEIARDPVDWDARVILARYLLDHGGTPQQLAGVYAGATPPDPDLAEMHEGLARLAGLAGDLDRALEEAQAVVALQPDSPNGYMLEAVVRVHRGDLRGAAECWREVLRIDPFAVTAHGALAQIEARLGEMGEATRHQRTFLELQRAAP